MSLLNEIKEIPDSKKDLKKFGLTLGFFLSFLGSVFLWRGRDYYLYLFMLSSAFLLVGYFSPILLKPIQKIWMAMALLMSWVMTRVILSLLFYLVITPLGFIMRLSGKNLLDPEARDQTTYWQDHASRDKSSYENQF